MATVDNRDELLLQVLERIEGKLDAQDEKILNNTLGHKRIVEKIEIRLARIERDASWHGRWIAGSSSTLFALIMAVAGWVWFHVSR